MTSFFERSQQRLPNHVRPTIQVAQMGDGTTSVELKIPGSEAVLTLTMEVEPMDEETWRVSIPWPAGLDARPLLLDDGHEVTNGVLYVARPDKEET